MYEVAHFLEKSSIELQHVQGSNGPKTWLKRRGEKQQQLELGRLRIFCFFEGFGYFGEVVGGHF